MRTQSPYRSLPVERRLALVMFAIKTSKEARAAYIQRMVARGGGFRAVTLQSWSFDKLAKEVVRLGVENPSDELELLQLLYVDLEPGIQTTFLETAGVRHEKGRIPEDLEPPFADEAAVRRGVAAVKEQHGEDGMRYLRTLARYYKESWPGIEVAVAEAETGAED